MVLFSAVSALCTPASAEYTAACADATLPGEGVEVVVAVELVFDAELPPPEDDEWVEPLAPDDEGLVLGTTTVTVTLGVVFVVVVVLDPGFPDFDFVVDVPGVDDVLGGVPGWKAAYCTAPAGAE